LKELCEARNIPTSGNKNELIERLLSSSDDLSIVDDLPVDEDELLGDDDDEEIDEEADCENLLIDDSEIQKDNSVETKQLPTDTDTSSMNIVDDKISTKPTKIVLGSAAKNTTIDDGIKILTKEEIQERRAAKFGSNSDDEKKNDGDKKKARAERFGIAENSLSSKSGEKSTVDVDTLKKRADRFGQVVSSSLLEMDKNDKILKRKQRFGEVSVSNIKTSKVSSTSNNDLLKKRAERFSVKT